MFQDLYVALVTPFSSDGSVNIGKLKEMVRFHAEAGTEGLVLCGTTGEAACLTQEERTLVIETVAGEARGRLKIVAGAGARSTKETIELVAEVTSAGAEAALVVTPFYVRPGPEALFAHFEAVAEESKIPVMLYNVPSRTGVDLPPDTVARLAELDKIAAIKEARPDIDRITELGVLCKGKIDVMSGHDPNLLPALSAGAKGVVSVVGNIVPLDVVLLIDAFKKGDMERACLVHFRLFEISSALNVDTNPVPIKCAMNLLGWDVGGVRLPLIPLSGEKRKTMGRRLSALGFGS